jgi:YD repeat-containing protein
MFPDGIRTRIFPLARDALSQLSYQFDNRGAAAHSKVITDKRRDGYHQLPDGAGFAPARGFPLTITQTQRPVEIGTPDGNRTHTSRNDSGRSIAVELRGDQMGKWRDRTEAVHAGNRTRSA